MNKDLNYIAALEKAMKEQYGEISIQNPKNEWNPEKQIKFLEDSKELLKKEYSSESTREKIDLDGVLIPKKLINRNNHRYCQYCVSYSFDRNDDVYFTKFDCCNKCFVKYIEDREERWKNGWRPNGA